MKLWDGPGRIDYAIKDDSPIPAMPELEEIFSEHGLQNLVDKLAGLEMFHYETSLTAVREVRRVPLKVCSTVDSEIKHQTQSYDGLRQFYPFDIYDSNISCTTGLLQGLRCVQRVDGFGDEKSARGDKYSILLVDIAIYWQLFRILYSFTGLAPIRQDLFMCLGFWHTYAHAHRLIWAEFRSTFLAASWFTLFPEQTLLFAPKLLQSSTFFLYLQMSYKSWRSSLLRAIEEVKRLMVNEQLEFLKKFGKYKPQAKQRSPGFR